MNLSALESTPSQKSTSLAVSKEHRFSGEPGTRKWRDAYHEISTYLAGKHREHLLAKIDECVLYYKERKLMMEREAERKRAESGKSSSSRTSALATDAKHVVLSDMEKDAILRARQEVFSFIYLCLSGPAKLLARPLSEERPMDPSKLVGCLAARYGGSTQEELLAEQCFLTNFRFDLQKDLPSQLTEFVRRCDRLHGRAHIVPALTPLQS